MNADQERFIADRHGFDIVLKARQKGFTTVIQLDMLDDCLFVPNTAAGVIAHNLTDARHSSPTRSSLLTMACRQSFREIVSATNDTVRSLKFSNGSSIRVGTSLRSGTLQRLHVSEYGKLCAKFPEKAREVKSGAFNTVQVGQCITVESTAEGHAGHFYEITKAAQDRMKEGRELTELDFKFHFAPWFTSPEYVLEGDVTETTQQTEYFAKLEAATGITLSREQRNWYIKKAEQQGGDMKREYPSTPEEAFEASIEGRLLRDRDGEDARAGPHLPHPDPQQARRCVVGLGRRRRDGADLHADGGQRRAGCRLLREQRRGLRALRPRPERQGLHLRAPPLPA
jgi:hypothetical protein